MRRDMVHGDVLVGACRYDELDHELVDGELSGYHPVIRETGQPVTDEPGSSWTADDEAFTEEHIQRMRHIVDRPDAAVRTDVLRMLVLDNRVPVTIDAQVSAGIVTLTGAVGTNRERQDATYLAGLVRGVFWVIDNCTHVAC